MMHNAFSLDGMSALITGGTRGIGMAIAQSYLRAGANVTICGRKQEGVEAALEQLSSHGQQSHGVVAHVGNSDDLVRLVEQAEEKFGPIQVLVNNAGTNPYLGPIVDSDDEVWDKTFAVNLRGPYVLSKLVGEKMIAAGSGSIINVSSIAGLEAAPKMGIYSVTKAGLIMLTKVMAREWGQQGVRVNCICPGLVKTELSKALWHDNRRLKMFLARMALGRIGESNDVAGAAVYLASHASSFVTGAVLQVDGGMVI